MELIHQIKRKLMLKIFQTCLARSVFSIAPNGLVLGEGWALVVQNFKLETNDYRKHKR